MSHVTVRPSTPSREAVNCTGIILTVIYILLTNKTLIVTVLACIASVPEFEILDIGFAVLVACVVLVATTTPEGKDGKAVELGNAEGA
jgi:hypothetical protein